MLAGFIAINIVVLGAVVLPLLATNIGRGSTVVRFGELTVSEPETSVDPWAFGDQVFQNSADIEWTITELTSEHGAKISAALASGAGAQNLYETVAGDAGSRTATSPTDTLTIAGGTGISTIMAGTTLTVTNDSPNVEQDIWYEISDDDGTAFPPTDPEMHLSFVTTEGITIDGSSGVPNTTQFTIGLDPEITIGDSSNTGSIVIHDGNGETQTITVTNQAGNINFVLPDTDGDSGDFLTTDGGGNTSWGVPTDTDTNTWMLTAPLEDGRTIQAGSATPTPITHPLTITDNGTITEYGVYIAAWIEAPLGVDTLTVGLYVNGSLVDSFTSTAGNAADGTYLFTTCSEAVTAWQNIELKIDVDDNDAVLAGAWVAEGTP